MCFFVQQVAKERYLQPRLQQDYLFNKTAQISNINADKWKMIFSLIVKKKKSKKEKKLKTKEQAAKDHLAQKKSS